MATIQQAVSLDCVVIQTRIIDFILWDNPLWLYKLLFVCKYYYKYVLPKLRDIFWNVVIPYTNAYEISIPEYLQFGEQFDYHAWVVDGNPHKEKYGGLSKEEIYIKFPFKNSFSGHSFMHRFSKSEGTYLKYIIELTFRLKRLNVDSLLDDIDCRCLFNNPSGLIELAWRKLEILELESFPHHHFEDINAIAFSIQSPNPAIVRPVVPPPPTSETLALSRQFPGFTLGNTNKKYKRFGSIGCCYISKALHYMPCLKQLSLEHNNIGDVGCYYLSQALTNLQHLEILELSENNIGNEGVQYLYRSLRTMEHLKSIDLSSNKIGYDGFGYLAILLKDNIYITEESIDTYGNYAPDECWEVFSKKNLRNNPKKKFLEFYDYLDKHCEWDECHGPDTCTYHRKSNYTNLKEWEVYSAACIENYGGDGPIVHYDDYLEGKLKGVGKIEFLHQQLNQNLAPFIGIIVTSLATQML